MSIWTWDAEARRFAQTVAAQLILAHDDEASREAIITTQLGRFDPADRDFMIRHALLLMAALFDGIGDVQADFRGALDMQMYEILESLEAR